MMHYLVYLPKEQDPRNSTALSVALSLKTDGDRIVTVSAEGFHSDPTAYGADEAVLFEDDSFAGSDSYAVARIIGAYLGKVESPYLVLSDSVPSSECLPAILAGMLGTEQFYYAQETVRKGADIICTQDYGDSRPVSIVHEGAVLQFIPANICLHPVCGPKGIACLGRIDLGLGRFSVGAEGSRLTLIGGE